MTDDEFRNLQADQMTVNIEKMRFDIDESRRQSDERQIAHEAQAKWELRKLAVSLLLATAAAIGAGVGIGNLIWAHRPAPALTPPQVIILQQPAQGVTK